MKHSIIFVGLDVHKDSIRVVETGDLGRFEHPRQLMAYLGLVPSDMQKGVRELFSP